MTSVVHFRPELADWLVGALDQGVAPGSLVQTMIDEQMQPAVAQALVDAFVEARRDGRAVPQDTIIVGDEPVFSREPPLVARGAVLPAGDRAVRVLARATAANVMLLGEVMSAAECVELITLARPRLEPSTVVDPQTGEDIVAGYRNSVGMFFRPGENELVSALDRRFAELMGLPADHGEGLQVLCYGVGGETAPHFDFVAPTNDYNRASVRRSGQRLSTLLVYLADVAVGGETVFPRAGFSVQPARGHAVYFESCNSRGQLDPRSLHAGRPVECGEKWVATKWMRDRRFVPLDRRP